MNEIQIFENARFGQVRTLDENGKTLFCGSDVAKALGYSNPRDALARHCKGVVKRDTPTKSGIQQMSFIPEGDIYRLAAKSELPGADEFERWIFDEVIPSIRKTGGYMVNQEQLSPELRLLINLELKQKQHEAALEAVNERVDNIGEVISLDTKSWRDDAHRLIVGIAQTMGGNQYIMDVNKEIYRLVDRRAAVSLETRLTNKRRRMAEAGACKSKRDRMNKLDVIADDKKLIEIYVAIVKEMAVKYGVTLESA